MRQEVTSAAFLPSRLPQSLFFRASSTCTEGNEKPARLCRSAMVLAFSMARSTGLLNIASTCSMKGTPLENESDRTRVHTGRIGGGVEIWAAAEWGFTWMSMRSSAAFCP